MSFIDDVKANKNKYSYDNKILIDDFIIDILKKKLISSIYNDGDAITIRKDDFITYNDKKAIIVKQYAYIPTDETAYNGDKPEYYNIELSFNDVCKHINADMLKELGIKEVKYMQHVYHSNDDCIVYTDEFDYDMNSSESLDSLNPVVISMSF